MAGLQKLVEKIINELTRIQGLSLRDVARDDNFPLPRLIATGNGGTLVVSKDIDRLIGAVAKCLKDANSTLANSVSDEEWTSWVRKAGSCAKRSSTRAKCSTIRSKRPLTVSATA
jgi:hypothetical protein